MAALSTGFDTVTRHLWLLLLPAVLDVFLWVGPRLKASGLSPMLTFDAPAGLDAQTRLVAQDVQQWLRQVFESFNWMSFLRPPLLGVPGLMGGADNPMPVSGSPIDWQVSDPLTLLGVILILSVIGIGLGGLFWSLIARQARDGRIDWGAALGRMVTVWPRLVGLGFFILGTLLAIWIVAALISMVLGPALGFVSTLVVMAGLSLIIWLLFYFTFSLHGVVVYNQRVLDAVRTSMWLGRKYFWSVFGIVIALIAVEWGMGLIWRLAPMDSWLWAVSICANAFVVAGLSMATMLFYLDRVPIPSSALGL